MEFPVENEIFLVISDLNKIAISAIEYLLEKQKSVRLVIKEKEKATQIFKEKVKSFESIIECDVTSHDTSSIDHIFQENSITHQKVSYVISVLSSTYRFSDNIERSINHILNSITRQNLKAQIERFVLVSSSNVTTSFTFSSICRNILHNNILYHTMKAEHSLRNSGVKYLIVRPSALHLGDSATAFTLDQGDKIKGHITPTTVGKVAIDTMLDHFILPNTTFECSSKDRDLSQKYSYTKSQYSVLKQDNLEQENKRKNKHLVATRAALGLLSVLFVSAVYAGVKIFRNSLNPRKKRVSIFIR